MFLCNTDLVIKIGEIMTAAANGENVRQYASRFCLIVKQILGFLSSTNLVREAENLSPNFRRIALRCFTLSIIAISIGRSIFSKIFNQFC